MRNNTTRPIETSIKQLLIGINEIKYHIRITAMGGSEDYDLTTLVETLDTVDQERPKVAFCLFKNVVIKIETEKVPLSQCR